jgi:hypothetical protein
VLLSNDGGFQAFLDDHVTSERSYYLKVEPEHGVSFLGNVLHRDDQDQVQVAPNINSFLVNWLCPEHSIIHPSRRDFHHIGWTARKQHFKAAPLYGEAFEIWSRIHRKYFSENLNLREDWAASVSAHQFKDNPMLRDFDASELTASDREVILDPSKLAYKYETSDISAAIADLFVAQISFDQFYPLIENNLLV